MRVLGSLGAGPVLSFFILHSVFLHWDLFYVGTHATLIYFMFSSPTLSLLCSLFYVWRLYLTSTIQRDDTMEHSIDRGWKVPLGLQKSEKSLPSKNEYFVRSWNKAEIPLVTQKIESQFSDFYKSSNWIRRKRLKHLAPCHILRI